MAEYFSGELKEYSLPIAASVAPSSNAIWYPYCFFLASKHVYDFAKVFLHVIPGYIFDVLAIIKGRKER